MSTRAAAPAKVARILVADDDVESRRLVQATLENEGHAVVLAADGQDAIEAFDRERPDCVLLDVRMPNVDGFEACRRIRQLPGGLETPIIFVTALRDIDTFERSLRAGGDDFLTKPIRLAELAVRVEVQLKLRSLGASLRETYDAMRTQRDELLRVQLQKERLGSFVVHDLKNPIHAIDLHAQLLLRSGRLGPEERDAAAVIRREVRHLLRLVFNLLDISKAEEGQLAPSISVVALDALVGEVAANVEVRARSAELSLVLGVPPDVRVRVDRDLVARILENLVDNALRHARTRVCIEADLARPGAVVVRVVDDGPGIPDGQRETIFEMYSQLGTSGAPASRQGRGLGLAFCRLAVEAHGGRIWVEDAGTGTAFCFEVARAD